MTIVTFLKKSLAIISISSLLIPICYAQNAEIKDGNLLKNTYLNRGEAVSMIVHGFNLKIREAEFINQCLSQKDDCFFVFSARSLFDQLKLEPLMLYPDVPAAYRYSDEINVASMLDLVNGYIYERNSPFRPRSLMRRIDALKVVLGAAKLLNWKERFEIVSDLGSEDALSKQKTLFSDVDSGQTGSWWYARYLNFALEHGIIEPSTKFRPDDFITDQELNFIIENAKKAMPV